MWHPEACRHALYPRAFLAERIQSSHGFGGWHLWKAAYLTRQHCMLPRTGGANLHWTKHLLAYSLWEIERDVSIPKGFWDLFTASRYWEFSWPVLLIWEGGEITSSLIYLEQNYLCNFLWTIGHHNGKVRGLSVTGDYNANTRLQMVRSGINLPLHFEEERSKVTVARGTKEETIRHAQGMEWSEATHRCLQCLWGWGGMSLDSTVGPDNSSCISRSLDLLCCAHTHTSVCCCHTHTQWRAGCTCT